MAANGTPVVRNEPKSVNFCVQTCCCGFAMLSIANLQGNVCTRRSEVEP